jgi:DNA repair protein RadC
MRVRGAARARRVLPPWVKLVRDGSARIGEVAAGGPLLPVFPVSEAGSGLVGGSGGAVGGGVGVASGTGLVGGVGAGLGVVAESVSAVAAELPLVRDAADVWRLLGPRCVGETVEVFVAGYLDGRNRMIAASEVGRGTLTSCLVHPRELFRVAVAIGAASVVVGHNHPSEDPRPSGEDVALTKRLKDAGEILGIRVLDHVVMTASRYISLSEQGRC